MDDSDTVAIEDARTALQRLLAEQAQAGVPEQVLLGLLREQAATIERRGYIPRRWGQPDQQEASQR
jgi:hypothetical protein